MEQNPDIKCDLTVTNNSHPPKDLAKNKRMKSSESDKQNLMNGSSEEKLAKKNNNMVNSESNTQNLMNNASNAKLYLTKFCSWLN